MLAWFQSRPFQVARAVGQDSDPNTDQRQDRNPDPRPAPPALEPCPDVSALSNTSAREVSTCDCPSVREYTALTGHRIRRSCQDGGEKRERPRGVSLGGVRQFPAMTYSRAIRTTIGPGCLTAVFGMGTGVAIRVCSPECRSVYQEGSGKGVASLHRTRRVPAPCGRRAEDQCGQAFGC